MKFSDSDIRANTPRPLRQCGAMVALHRDRRWRDLPHYGDVIIINGFPFERIRIDTLDRIEEQQRQRARRGR